MERRRRGDGEEIQRRKRGDGNSGKGEEMEGRLGEKGVETE